MLPLWAEWWEDLCMKREANRRSQCFSGRYAKDRLTQTDVAKASGYPQSFVSKYESGERRLDLLELGDVRVAIGVPLVEFVKRFAAAAL
jgi:transcriptional regulator with XRE-family HTH domain